MQSRVCKFDPIICNSILKEVSEMNLTVDNLKRMPIIMGHYPGGSSSKNIQHFQQYGNKAEFKKFDYG